MKTKVWVCIFTVLVLVGCVKKKEAVSVKPPSQSTAVIPKSETSARSSATHPKASLSGKEATPKGAKIVFSSSAQNINRSYTIKKHQTSRQKFKVALEYNNADIPNVIKQILGDILKKNYIIHPQVKGVISLKITGNYTEDKLLDVLSQALELAGVSLVKKGDAYLVVPSSQSASFLGEGFKALVYFPKFLNVTDLQSVVATFISPEGRVFINPSKGYIFIIDKQENVSSIENLLRTLDIDFLAQKEIKVVKLVYSETEEAVKTLETFIKGTGLPPDTMTIIPVERLNYLILISSNREAMDRALAFLKLIDVPQKNGRKRVYIYKVQYVKAKDLADTLISFFTGKKKIEVKSKTRKTKPIASQILKEEVVIIPDETSNTLLIEATPDDYAKIERLLRNLDVVPRQVLIEVLIAEISLNKDFEYGVEWWLKSRNGHYEKTFSINYGLQGNNLIGFTYYGINPDNFWNFLYFLATKSRLEVLSSPHITVRDNEKAVINVGQEVPIVTMETTSNLQIQGTSGIDRRIQYRDVGVILNVTPHISEDGYVTLEISQEVSNAQQNTVSGIDSPIITKRRTETTLIVKDGHAIIIGGIIQHIREKVKKKVPLLGDIPYLGSLFSYEKTTNRKTELIVMLTPHVIRSAKEADIITNIFKEKINVLKHSSLFSRETDLSDEKISLEQSSD